MDDMPFNDISYFHICFMITLHFNHQLSFNNREVHRRVMCFSTLVHEVQNVFIATLYLSSTEQSLNRLWILQVLCWRANQKAETACFTFQLGSYCLLVLKSVMRVIYVVYIVSWTHKHRQRISTLIFLNVSAYISMLVQPARKAGPVSNQDGINLPFRYIRW